LDFKYAQKENTIDIAARNILNSIDKLDKRVRGTRNCYDVLCEFLHPNVGDMHASTIKSSVEYDGFGTRHLIRDLGIGPKDFTNSPDIKLVISQVFSICGYIFQRIPSVFEEFGETTASLNLMAKSFAHQIREENKMYFKRRDIFPCMSGVQIRNCK
jgi:hypothetical protein